VPSWTPNLHLCTPSASYFAPSTPLYTSCGLVDNLDPRQFATETSCALITWTLANFQWKPRVPSWTPNLHLCTPSSSPSAPSMPFYTSCGLVCPHVVSWTTRTLANLQWKPDALGSNCVHPAAYLSSGLSLKPVPSIRVASVDRYYIFPCNFTPRYTKTASRMNFEEYSSPSPHLLFSADFFSKLVFGKVTELQFPTIAPPGSVTRQDFSLEEPHGAASTLMSSHDVIPNVLDLLPTTSSMKHAYAMGMRSVSLEFCVGVVQYSFCYHFAKVRNYELAFVDMCSFPLYYRLD
jgi:hypothetical protein